MKDLELYEKAGSFMITWAKKQWIPEMKNIWRECFTEEEGYIDFYFKSRFREENTLVWLEESKPAAVASLLPAFCWKRGNSNYIKKPVCYIYGVATAKKMQGRGISTRLLAYIVNYLKISRQTGILVPGQESLKSFYEKRGFYLSYIREKREASPDKNFLKTAQITRFPAIQKKINAVLYKEIRDLHFAQENYVEWDSEAIFYAIKENEYRNGFASGIYFEREKHLVMGYWEGNILVIRETTLPLPKLAPYVQKLFPERSIEKIVQPGIVMMSNDFRWRQEGYFNLALD